jgi:hypothetical protein
MILFNSLVLEIRNYMESSDMPNKRASFTLAAFALLSATICRAEAHGTLIIPAHIVPAHRITAALLSKSARQLALVKPVGSHSTLQLTRLLGTGSHNYFLSSAPQLSGATRALQTNLKFISEGTLKNTVETLPLNNVSGQFNGTVYYTSTNQLQGTYSNYPAFYPFGSNAFNNGSAYVATNISNLSNSLSTGLHPVSFLPSTFLRNSVSGAERAYARLYDTAAAGGYNTGLSVLQHPTGGVLFGTTYYAYGGNTYQSYPGFFAFGNSYFTSSAGAFNSYGISLSKPLASYIQFGKLTRLVKNGLLSGTQYYPNNYNPPYGTTTETALNSYGYFNTAIGSNPFNTGIYNLNYLSVSNANYLR